MPTSMIVTGTGLVTPSWPIPEERRTVTVLFADIVGSTALVDRLDPEDVRSLQQAYFEAVARVLHRWDGVVEKYVGDAVMALFGARHSDGFDAYRAVRAGLEIQRAVDRKPLATGTAVRIRVGVATGEAVVDLPGSRDGGHGTASGAVITLAARLQAYAPPGAVVFCAATRRATAGLTMARRLPPVTVPGKAAPLELWRAEDPGRTGPAKHRGPLVGRRRELADARDQIVRAARERSPRWVSLIGPIGSGRSRLLHELVRAVPGPDGGSPRWCVAYCPPYAEQVLAPVADLVREFAAIHPTDGPVAVTARLTATLADLVPAHRLPCAVRALTALLTAPDGSAAASEGATTFRQVLLAQAARQPVVVAVDDLDRADPRVDDFLRDLFLSATWRSLPLAVVVTNRPRWADVLPGPAGQRHRHRIVLAPLPTVQTGRLLRHLLVRAGRPAVPVDRLLPLVAGNPGHATAYARLVAEDGLDPAADLPMPESVRRTAEARLDLLDGGQRAVFMAGASLDGDFRAATVDRLLDWPAGRSAPVLRELVLHGLLVRRPGAGGYAIAEPALRRVAVERLPRSVRAEFARRALTGPAGTDDADQAGADLATPVPGTRDAAPRKTRDAVLTGARGTVLRETRGTVLRETRDTVLTETRDALSTEARGALLTRARGAGADATPPAARTPAGSDAERPAGGDRRGDGYPLADGRDDRAPGRSGLAPGVTRTGAPVEEHPDPVRPLAPVVPLGRAESLTTATNATKGRRTAGPVGGPRQADRPPPPSTRPAAA
ncbi:adenylate/guanylate cyclase domain-containing protein [Micromonospora yangpuensis]|uniref:Adenylate cyclase, class 3 n=1 Tax=Micromonospora yangpuensis TaxID=683228 RepID=A0A1C6URJ5_9ACTN|nr:adenylate/guanylate cyclase domain-containing protein [Micromonospora yangpuensis]GGM06918.1 hypothetical protein GCM10012279_26110 [Micromonospora yangpuensis]SCL56636.1 Adenylate cyclase, class 3 [Micromonospora yangpuensis]